MKFHTKEDCRTTVDSKYYQILRQWIANGAMPDKFRAKVVKIQLYPCDRVAQAIGAGKCVMATYADGTLRRHARSIHRKR